MVLAEEPIYNETMQQEGFVGEMYGEQLVYGITNLHEECRVYLDEILGINPNTYGNYLILAKNIINHGFDAYGSYLTEEQAIRY
jgi:hypothetical protein